MKVNLGKIQAQVYNIIFIVSVLYFMNQFIKAEAYKITGFYAILLFLIIVNTIIVGRSK